MPFLSALTDRGRRIEAHRPWPRDRRRCRDLAAGNRRARRREATLLGLWSDGEAVHMGLIAEAKIARDQLAGVPSAAFLRSGLSHAPALRLERTIRDLYGLEPEGLPDATPVARPRPVGRLHSRLVHAGRRPRRAALTPFSRPRARRCTRSLSDRCMLGSSSPATFASRRTARPSCGWRSAWAMCTRASRG